MTSRAASITKGDAAPAVSATTLALGALSRRGLGKPTLQHQPRPSAKSTAPRHPAPTSSQVLTLRQGAPGWFQPPPFQAPS